MLLHGIMSSIAEFYSRNLATEARKGMRQEAQLGGTPGRAPFGYHNVRQRSDDGREIRTIAVDPERAPVVQWVFEAYASGEWTLVQLAEALKERGVLTLARPKSPARPLSRSGIDNILRNRFYVGVVLFEGVEYPGRHEPLVGEELWHEAQLVREARVQSGEKPRVRPHYLKGAIYCGRCGEAFGIEVVRNRQGRLYPYFYCLGRQLRKNGCTQRAIPVDLAEEAVERHWRKVTLPKPQLDVIESLVGEHLARQLPRRAQEEARSRRAIAQLEAEREKLLHAHYADAVPLDLLRREQARIARQIGEATATLDRQRITSDDLRARLQYALILLQDAHTYYGAAADRIRRQLNQAVFQRLWIDDDEVVDDVLTAPYQRLLDEDLRQTLAAEEGDGPGEQAADCAQPSLTVPHECRPVGRSPAVLLLSGRTRHRPGNAARGVVVGSNPGFLVELRGELSRPSPPLVAALRAYHRLDLRTGRPARSRP